MMRWMLVVLAAAVLMGAAGPNQPPRAETDYAFLPDYLPYVTVNVLRNDYDPDGDPLEVVNVLLAEGGYAFVLKDDRVLFWWEDGVTSGGRVLYVIEDVHGAQAKSEIVIECCAQISREEQ